MPDAFRRGEDGFTQSVKRRGIRETEVSTERKPSAGSDVEGRSGTSAATEMALTEPVQSDRLEADWTGKGKNMDVRRGSKGRHSLMTSDEKFKGTT